MNAIKDLLDGLLERVRFQLTRSSEYDARGRVQDIARGRNSHVTIGILATPLTRIRIRPHKA